MLKVHLAIAEGEMATGQVIDRKSISAPTAKKCVRPCQSTRD